MINEHEARRVLAEIREPLQVAFITGTGFSQVVTRFLKALPAGTMQAWEVNQITQHFKIEPSPRQP